jgi:uncharacterized membrane protein YdjX (TVP38/TMEM64 family)
LELINSVVNYCIELLSSSGLILGFFLVFIECFIPALPLSVFVAFNVSAFGFFMGILISWIATCSGSFICFMLFKLFKKQLSKIKYLKNINSSIEKFKIIKFTHLVLILTLPFTPSFLINILGGLSGMSKEKFLIAILIGKLFEIIFWGFIGKNLLESLTDMRSLIFIFITLIIAYIISKIVSKKMNIE